MRGNAIAQQRTWLYGLVRHGETIYNREKRVQGHGDSPLSQQGRNSVKRWAEVLGAGGWEHILASDLGRVGETVTLLNQTLQLPVTFDPRLREQHWGDWEGLLVDTVHAEHGAELAVQTPRGWDFCPPRGESRRQVRDRAFAALADCRQTQPATRVLVVCHLGVIKCLVYAAAGCTFLPDQNFRVEKRSLHHLFYEKGLYRLGDINVDLPESRS